MEIKNLIEWIFLPVMWWLIFQAIEQKNWRAMANEKFSNNEKNEHDLNLTNSQLQEVVMRLDKIIAIHEEKHKVTENRLKKLESENNNAKYN